MSEEIRRDIGSPFDPVLDAQEFVEFGCPPDTWQIVEDLQKLEPGSRALRLFAPALADGVVLAAERPPEPAHADPDEEGEDEDPLVLLPTPDRVAFDQFFSRRGMHRAVELEVPGIGEPIEIWSFEDKEAEGDGKTWPGPTIRVREGEIAHTRMANSRGPHTIHHHGIEPTPANDGVGHLTFDVGAGVRYDYQWQAGEAGTYFYHCHVNTVLHFEMGMYGMLIVDPAAAGAPYADGGPGKTYVADQLVDYDAEAIWVADDIDRRWHGHLDVDPGNQLPRHGHHREAGIICGGFQKIGDNDNPLLHIFQPDVFLISGSPPETRGAAGSRQLITATGVTVSRGQKLLVRALNASYTTSVWRFPTSLPGQVIAADGRTLGRAPFGRYSAPFSLASVGHQLTLTTAQRRDVLIDTGSAAAGPHQVEIDFHHWITSQIFAYGRLATTITVI